jgi:excisionase family DNA binding protein
MGTLVNNSDSLPEYGRIGEACRRYGLSRTRLYLLAGENAIRFIKVGNATLVDFASLRDYLATCPSADIGPQKVA